jgi:hypothetical protein
MEHGFRSMHRGFKAELGLRRALGAADDGAIFGRSTHCNLGAANVYSAYDPQGIALPESSLSSQGKKRRPIP